MNINKLILREAALLGLDTVCTGGNCDFIIKYLGNGMQIVLAATDENGGACPESLNAPCEMVVFPNSEWTESFNIPFPTMRDAMRALAAGYGV